jgi:hypothetical protein
LAPSELQNLSELPRQEDIETVLRMTSRLATLKEQGLKGIHLVYCWAARRIAPLKERPNLLCDYTGSTDPSRTIVVNWKDKEFADEHVKTWTSLPFVSFNTPLEAHSAVSLVPLVIFVVPFQLVKLCVLLISDIPVCRISMTSWAYHPCLLKHLIDPLAMKTWTVVTMVRRLSRT